MEVVCEILNVRQWIAVGKKYELEAAEQILDLKITTVRSRFDRRIVRPGMSQVESVTILTNLRKICWGPSMADMYDEGEDEKTHTIEEIVWDFNAMFDRVQCTYNETCD